MVEIRRREGQLALAGSLMEKVQRVRRRVRGEGELATAAKPALQCAFQAELAGRGGIERRGEFRRLRGPRLHGDRALPTAGAICAKVSGRNSSPAQPSIPSRRNPAAARMVASAAPSAIFRSRVSTLPRISVNVVPGNWRLIWSRRRGLPVAMVAGVATPCRTTSTSRGPRAADNRR